MVGTNVIKLRKCVAVALAMLMMILSLSYTGTSSDAANSSKAYNVYNANGNFLRSYSLAPLESNDNTRTIIDGDDRVIDWTKSGVVKIITSSGSFASGFVIDDHTIATAAHCVYDYKNRKAESICEILLFDTNGNVTKEATPVEFHVPTTFITATYNKKYKSISDYALITVKEDLSSYNCFELGVPLDSFSNGETNATVSVTGFPEEHNDLTKHMMYTGNGKICGLDSDKNLTYDADVSGGNSGGPVFITETVTDKTGKYGKTYYTVVAINVAQSKNNIGTRIDTNLIHFYKSNDNIEW